MAKYVIDESTLRAIAESIRTKKGTAEAINPEDMAAEIIAIATGENLDAVLAEQGSLIDQIKAALQGKAAGGSGLPAQEKAVQITANGTVEVLPDEGYTLSKVVATVAVPIPEGYVKPTGTLEVAENGSYDVTGYASVEVNVAGGNGAPTTISGVNLHDTVTDTPNTYLQGSTLKEYNGWTTTDFIPVEDGKFYLAYSTSKIDAKYCSEFDENKGGAAALTGVINCTNKNKPVFLIGHNGYFRFSGTAAQIAALEFYEVVNLNWEV